MSNRDNNTEETSIYATQRYLIMSSCWIKRCLRSIRNPIVFIRLSHDCPISTMEFPIQLWWLKIEIGHSLQSCHDLYCLDFGCRYMYLAIILWFFIHAWILLKFISGDTAADEFCVFDFYTEGVWWCFYVPGIDNNHCLFGPETKTKQCRLIETRLSQIYCSYISVKLQNSAIFFKRIHLKMSVILSELLHIKSINCKCQWYIGKIGYFLFYGGIVHMSVFTFNIHIIIIIIIIIIILLLLLLYHYYYYYYNCYYYYYLLLLLLS